MKNLRYITLSVYILFCIFHIGAQNQVGTIQGSFDVNATGSANYDIPLKMVPGTAGMAPSLSITYNSQGANGILGQGFNLSGLSAITRVPQNYHNDGTLTGINFSTDKFALDGNRLIAVNGTYGANGTEYRTENNIFAKIISYGTVSGDPQKFIVYTKDGLISEYGYTSDSRFEAEGQTEILSWQLNKVKDTKGNYFTITYEENNSSGYCIPTRIDYTGNVNAGLQPYASYRFTYVTRGDIQSSYIAGSKQQQSKRLTKITNFHNESQIWKYDISYEGGTLTDKSRVKTVTITNKEGQKYNPLTFDYEHTVAPLGNVIYDKSYYPSNYLTHDSQIHIGDFNGDGIQDAVTVADNNLKATWKDMRLFTGKPNGQGFTYSGITDLDPLGCYGSNCSVKNLHIADFNGDGLSDVLVQYHKKVVDVMDIKIYEAHYKLLENNGNGFTYKPSYDFMTPYEDMSDRRLSRVIIGDANADGLADAYFIRDGESDTYVHCMLNNGNSFDSAISFNLNKDHSIYNSGDFNGDGALDIALLNKDGMDVVRYNCNTSNLEHLSFSTYPNSDHLLTFGDFNGDRMTDYVAYGYKDILWSNWYVALSTGSDFERIYFARKRDPRKDKVYPGDYNADGITDLLFMADKDKGGNWSGRELYHGNLNGAGFTQGDEGPVYPSLGQRFYFGDFNGDGATDFFIVDDEKGDADDFWHGYQLYHAGRIMPELVTGVTNGFGEKTTINYKPITDSGVYSKSSTNYQYPVMQVQAPFFVVSEVIRENGIGGTRQTEYDYKGLKVHLKGKGILGFDEFTSRDIGKDISSTTYFGFDTNEFISYSTGSKTQKGSTVLSESSNINVVDKDAHGVIFNYISESTQKEWDLNGALKADNRTTYDYDSYGNVTQLDLIQGAASNFMTTETTNTYTNNTSKWHLGRLTETSVRKLKVSSYPVINKSSFTYDSGSGLLKSETIEPNSSVFKVSKSYTHDAYGNILSSTTTSTGLPTLTTRSEYDAKGRFVVKSYDVENNLTQKTYNEHDGSVHVFKDINDLETTYWYDGFGRLTRVDYADGNYTVSSSSWVSGDSDAPSETNWEALYSVNSQKTGSAAVTSYYDKYGRKLRTVGTGFNNKKIYSDTYYNACGLVDKVCNPRYESESPQFTSYLYDALDRPIKETLPDGKYTQTAFNGLETTMTDIMGFNTTREYDLMGNLIKSTDDNGQRVNYEYNSQALCVKVTDPKGNVITTGFDFMGNRKRLTDPDLGTSTYNYNAYGQLTDQTDANGNTTSFEYDVAGRVTFRTETEGTTTYAFYTTKPHKGLLQTETGPNNISYQYGYDDYGRLTSKTENIETQTFATSFGYDDYGRINKTTYPTGFYVNNVYDQHGILISVNDNLNRTHWTLNDASAKGQMMEFTLGNGLNTIQGFDMQRGWLEQITTKKNGVNQLNYGYEYNDIGNLTKRTDFEGIGLIESFTYDNLHRLETCAIGSNELEMQYDEIGNITFKSDLGNYSYGAHGRMPHAVSGLYNVQGAINPDSMNIQYASFHKVKRIQEGNNILEIIYGPGHGRKIARQYDGGTAPLERYYIGSLFEREIGNGNTGDIHYIMAGGGCVAVYTENSTKDDELKYLHKDHLGSVCATSDENGNLIEKFSYDAWGKRRDANTWLGFAVQTQVSEKRGFTGHEHLDMFALVNMNGRMYDPVTARFLSPDPFVQMPDHTQGLNRFSYCLNNPLNLTDPSGYSWLSDAFKTLLTVAVAITVTVATAGSGTGFGIAILSGAAGGFAGGFTGVMLNGGNIGQAFKAGVIGGLVGGATAGAAKGIGKIFDEVGKFGREALRATAHGTVGGLSSIAQGGKFEHGFMAGSFSSLAGSGMQAAGLEAKGTLMVSSAVIGGTSSVLGGGKFSNGAITGAFTMWFNHLNGGEKDYSTPPDKINLSGSPESIIDGVNEWGEFYNWNVSTSQRKADGSFYNLDDIFENFGEGWKNGFVGIQQTFYPNNDAAFRIDFVDEHFKVNSNLRRQISIMKFKTSSHEGNVRVTLYNSNPSYDIRGYQKNTHGTKIAVFNFYKNERIRNHWR